MKLLVSCIPYDGGKSGISVYTREVVRALAEQGHELTLLVEPDEGAALAADTLLHAAEKESAYFSGAFRKGEDHRGDLYEMLYPSGSLREESLVYAPFTFQSLNNPNGGNALRILTHNESASGKLFCWRDSFGISLYPYLAESYSDALFSRSESYDLNQVLSFEADTLVLEIVERNLPRLAEMDLTIPD